MNKKQKITIVIVSVLFLCYFSYSFFFEREGKVEAKDQDIVVNDNIPDKEVKSIYKVDIKGQVEKPGVYEVNENARVIDVIEKAGGLKKNANTDFLNLSKKVVDGDVIWVYTTKEIEKLQKVKTVIEYVEKDCHCPDVSNSACITKPTTNNPGKININTASLKELITLNGIGDSKAKLIIEYRKIKLFTTIEEIKNVSGIGDSAYEKIKDFIVV